MLVDPKYVNFCQNLMLGLPKAAAARAAGLKTAASALRRPDVQQYMLFLQAEAAKKYELKRDDVIKMFLEAAEMAKTLEDPNALTNAAREIGRMLGHYEPEERKITLSVEQSQRRRELETLGEQQLLELAGEGVVDAEFTLCAPVESSVQ